MSQLLETVIEAHGGLERRNQVDEVSARLAQSGALWALKGQAGVLDDVVVTASLHQERVSHGPFGAADRHSSFTPERVAIESDDGNVLEALDEPRDSFAEHTPRRLGAPSSSRTSWARRCGTYLTQPFTFTMPGFQTSELEPWDEVGQQWRRLHFVAKLPRHPQHRTDAVLDDDGLLARHDYDVEISGGTSAAHHVSDYDDVAGIRLPTKHRIFPRAADGRSLADALVVDRSQRDRVAVTNRPIPHDVRIHHRPIPSEQS